MAVTRLTDIVRVFEDKWTYGDAKFGYESEVNQDHDTQYPLMMITPPESTIPEIYNGREEYDFEINFYNLYSQSTQSVVTLQKRWDNLQDLANEWLDFVLKNFQDGSVEVYLDPENISIERVKEVANDRLVQVKLTFTMSAFTKCFRPVSSYPSDISNLIIWLKADSKVTFDIPTKRVSAWADQSGNSNSVAQATVTKQPLRYGYDGANDKPYIEFDGTNDGLTSSSNSPMSSTSFTAFVVAKQGGTSSDVKPVFSYIRTATTIRVFIGFFNNKLFSQVRNSTTEASHQQTSGDTSSYGLIATSLNGTSARLTTQFNNETVQATNIAGWAGTEVFNQNNFLIGGDSVNGSTDADVAEIIVYNGELTTTQKNKVRDYLNYKYKIY